MLYDANVIKIFCCVKIKEKEEFFLIPFRCACTLPCIYFNVCYAENSPESKMYTQKYYL